MKPPSLLHASSVAALIFLVLPCVASSGQATRGELAPEVRDQLLQASASSAMSGWQRDYMIGLAERGNVAARDPGPAGAALAAEEAAPGPRDLHSAIYDPVRDRMIVFGGWNSVTNFNEVWSLSLAGTPAWTQLAPLGAPPSVRRWHSAIYDPVRDRMVVFGGFTGNIYTNDVWALSLGESPEWTQLTPAGTLPHERYRHSAIYDSARDRMVVFGGWFSGDNYGDVWSLSLGDTPQWTELETNGTPPTARYSHTAIYDPVRDRMVVFAGVDAGLLNDVWSLAFADTAWTKLEPGGTPPLYRYVHSAIYDPVRDRMVVFGGFDPAGFVADTWTMSLAGEPEWSALAPVGTLPPGRFGHSAIYDPVRDRMVVFGGFTGLVSLNDTWNLALAGSPAWSPMFAPGPYTLTVNAVNGSVTQDPLPTDGTYADGTAVLLTATPDVGFHFAGFSGDAVAATDTVTVLMTADRTVTASFATDSVTLVVIATNGSVSESPPPTGGKYAYGTAVLLAVTPDVGFHFAGFSGDAVATTDTVTVLMTADRTVTASFATDSVTLVVIATNGSVSESPPPTGGKYAYGTAVLLTDTPDEGYHFVDYTGDASAATDTVTVLMTGEKTVTAEFAPTLGVPGSGRPAVTLLLPSLPNPFRQSATMAFSVAHAGPVELDLYSVDGRRVRTLVRDYREPGEYRAAWDGRDDGGHSLASGVYYERLQTVDGPRTQIVTYLR